MDDTPIFLTGVTGFIGKRLLPLLLTEGRRLHLVVRDPSRLQVPEGAPLRIFGGDIADSGVIRRAMEGCRQGYHLAALVRHRAHPTEYDRSNILGTRNVLHTARELGLERLVYTSSVIVYANDPSPLKEESAQIRGGVFLNDYHRTKYYAHLEAVRLAAEGYPVVLAMPSSVFGPSDLTDSNRVLHWCRRFKRGSAMRWLPDGGQLVLNVAYGDDVARGIRSAMQFGRAGEEGYILGGANISIRDLLQRIAVLAEIPSRFRSIPVVSLGAVAAVTEGLARITRTRPLLTRGLVRSLRTSWAFSSEKAIAELGYVITPLEEALQRTFESA